MNDRPTDYLVLGSGLAGLSFAALMAKAGKKVKVIEAHEFPGGYGHTFEMITDIQSTQRQIYFGVEWKNLITNSTI